MIWVGIEQGTVGEEALPLAEKLLVKLNLGVSASAQ